MRSVEERSVLPVAVVIGVASKVGMEQSLIIKAVDIHQALLEF
jgi:hypothetical protein